MINYYRLDYELQNQIILGLALSCRESNPVTVWRKCSRAWGRVIVKRLIFHKKYSLYVLTCLYEEIGG